MEFTVQKADLLRELQLVQGVVEKKATVPVLANVLMKADREGLELVATDMDLGIQSLCEAQVKESGAILLNARRLYEIIKALPDDEIRFKVQDGERVRIRCGRADFKIAGQATEEFPTLRDCDFKGAIVIPMDVFRETIEKVRFAITVDDPRYAIYGALLLGRKGSLEMVATDGHRLACVKRQADIAPREEIRVIIPSKALTELVNLQAGPEGEIRIAVREGQIFFRSGLRTVQSRLFDGTFPSYEKVIPEGNDLTVRCGAEALEAALRRVSLLSAERTRAVKLTVEGSRMVVSTSNPDYGEAEEAVEIEGYKGDRLEIGFNARYLIEFLGVVGSGEVILELKDGNTQGMLRPADGDGVDYRYVVMPLRI